jgi:hypothetical protein
VSRGPSDPLLPQLQLQPQLQGPRAMREGMAEEESRSPGQSRPLKLFLGLAWLPAAFLEASIIVSLFLAHGVLNQAGHLLLSGTTGISRSPPPPLADYS